MNQSNNKKEREEVLVLPGTMDIRCEKIAKKDRTVEENEEIKAMRNSGIAWTRIPSKVEQHKETGAGVEVAD